MIGTILLFAKLALSGVIGFLKKIIAFLVAHPKILMCVVCLSIGLAGGWLVAQKSADRKVSDMKQTLEKAKQTAEKAAEDIKETSKAEADKNEKQITELQLLLADMSKRYEEALKTNKQKIKYVKVAVPGKPETTVDVGFEGDKQVCRSYPSTYVDQLNDMVKKTEESLK